MSYLALARKWRPRTFEDVVGQPHIVRALSNALTSGRVHHAFLFAGTRGVGKTTVARILARCLNCETGVTATPCGQCRSCTAIEEGRFIDLIEVDAASRTGIDDIRELLDNVQYTPGAGRYKVYLIDEVHMLSKPAFNALLKTLEEPPPHVKFLFATTDPQKLPVTVLSRCLQFNLKRLPASLIVARMSRICEAEGVQTEVGALQRIARAAAGSMRDGLSLLDQALAYGNEVLRESDVAEMLGSLDRARVIQLLQAIAAGDAAQLLTSVRELDELVPDWLALLDDLASALQKLATVQIAGESLLEDEDDPATLIALAKSLDPELTQLYYQIAITGRRDLPLAPEPRIGFEMLMLRLLAFSPAQLAATPTSPPAVQTSRPSPVAASAPASRAAPMSSAPSTALGQPADWPAFVQSLTLDGAARQLALHTECVTLTPTEIRLCVDRGSAHLLSDQMRNRLIVAVHARLGDKLRVQIDLHDQTRVTGASREEQQQSEAMQRARKAIETDPNVRQLTEQFGAEVVADSVRPVPPAGNGR